MPRLGRVWRKTGSRGASSPSLDRRSPRGTNGKRRLIAPPASLYPHPASTVSFLRPVCTTPPGGGSAAFSSHGLARAIDQSVLALFLTSNSSFNRATCNRLWRARLDRVGHCGSIGGGCTLRFPGSGALIAARWANRRRGLWRYLWRVDFARTGRTKASALFAVTLWCCSYRCGCRGKRSK